jgi:hypothetical protein
MPSIAHSIRIDANRAKVGPIADIFSRYANLTCQRQVLMIGWVVVTLATMRVRQIPAKCLLQFRQVVPK